MLSGLVNDVKWVCETDLKLDQYKSDYYFFFTYLKNTMAYYCDKTIY